MADDRAMRSDDPVAAYGRRWFDEDVTGRFLARPDWTILDCNEAFAQMLGVEGPSHLVLRRLTDLASDPMPLRKLLTAIRANGAAGPRDVQLERADGEPLQASVMLIGAFSGDALVAIRGQLVEVTESRRLQMRLLGAQRMEAIGKLAGGLAHDFNNLLTVISGHSERLVEALAAGHPLHASAAAIQRAAEHAASLTRALLAFSRRQVFELRPIAVHQLVADAGPLLAKVLGERIALRLDVVDEVPDIRADARQLEHVLVNLALNARDAMPDGGTFTVSVDTTEVGERPPKDRRWLRGGRYVRIIAADNGPGMDPVTKAHVFEPFFTTKAMGNGSGLGLATVYGIVKQSNGFVWVDSEPGRGATFTLLFPVADETSAGGRRAPRAETVLVVDEDDRIRTFIADALRRRGYHVLDTASAGRAVEIFASHPSRIHLLVADSGAAVAGGLSLDARLRAIDPMLQTLFMIPEPRDGAARPAAPSGHPVIEKPFTMQALGDAVRSVLDSGMGRRSSMSA
jgi:signal transduction histidine kinase